MITLSRLPSIALVLMLAATIAACGGSPSTSPSAGVATQQASPSPTDASSTSADALPSLDLPSDDAELEALIPDQVGGQPMTKASMKGDSFLDDAPDGGDAARTFFEGINVNPADVSVAFGFSPAGIVVQIFRAPGADAAALVEGFKEATDEDRDTPLEWSDANVGGKDVETAADADSEQTFFLYGVGDLMVVVGGDEGSAAEVLSGMP
jgi:hypothetical protein